MRKLSLFLLILIETITLFCLGVLGNRVADVVHLPNYLLLAGTALGIILATIIFYLRQSSTSKKSTEQSDLILGGSWRRRKFHKMNFGYHISTEWTDLVMELSMKLFLGLGVAGAILRYFFTRYDMYSQWYIMMGMFMVIGFIPLFITIREGKNPEAERNMKYMIDEIRAWSFFIVFYGVVMLAGVALGSLVLYIALLLHRF